MKKWICLLAVALALLLPLSAMAQQRVFDNANVFSAAEEQIITDAVDAFIQETGMDYAVITINESLGNQTWKEQTRSYYRSLGLGTGDDASGALYCLNFYPDGRYEYLYTDGKMIDYMTDARIESALNQSNPKLKDGLYAEGALAMIDAVLYFVRQGVPSNQFRFDEDTGEVLSVSNAADSPSWMRTVQANLDQVNPEGGYYYDSQTDTVYYRKFRSITMTEALIGAGVCLLIGLAFILIVSSRYKLKGSTYHYDYNANTRVDMTDSDDTYLRTTVTRTRRAQTTGGGGGGGSGGFSGGGGGSSVSSGGGGGGGRSF